MKKIILTVLIASLSVSTMMCYIALKENPQGEFISAEGYAWSELGMIFLLWFLVLPLLLTSLYLFVFLIDKIVRSIKKVLHRF